MHATSIPVSRNPKKVQEAQKLFVGEKPSRAKLPDGYQNGIAGKLRQLRYLLGEHGRSQEVTVRPSVS